MILIGGLCVPATVPQHQAESGGRSASYGFLELILPLLIRFVGLLFPMPFGIECWAVLPSNLPSKIDAKNLLKSSPGRSKIEAWRVP